MFKRLLVPLDGTAQSEASVPAALWLAERNAASVTLLHLVERRAPRMAHGESHLSRAEDAEAYLAAVARKFPKTTPVAWHVHQEAIGRVDRGIAEHIQELAPDTIVMSQHGSAGWKGVLFGRVSQQVMAAGGLPVLLVRPPFVCGPVLIPHDDEAAHSRSLAAGLELARLGDSIVHLLRVVPTRTPLKGSISGAGDLLPGATASLLELEQDEAVRDLSEHLRQARAAGLRAEASVERGEPARTIGAFAGRIRAGIVVRGTHGKAGAAAFWEGSVAARVCARTKASVLLVPAS